MDKMTASALQLDAACRKALHKRKSVQRLQIEAFWVAKVPALASHGFCDYSSRGLVQCDAKTT